MSSYLEQTAPDNLYIHVSDDETRHLEEFSSRGMLLYSQYPLGGAEVKYVKSMIVEETTNHLLDLIEEQRMTIGALNMAIGGKDSCTTENLIHAGKASGSMGLVYLLEIINRVAHCGTVDSWMTLSDEEKRSWFALMNHNDSEKAKTIRQLEGLIEDLQDEIHRLSRSSD